MIFTNRKEMMFWIGCFVIPNVCILIPILSIENVPNFIWGIVISNNAFFIIFILVLKYLLNKKDLKKYNEAVEELKKHGVIITPQQLDKIFMSGFDIDNTGQIVRTDRNGEIISLSPGHKIIYNRAGNLVEIDENGNEIKEPTSKKFIAITVISIVGTVVVIGGFVVLCIFMPWVGVPLFILFLLVLFLVALKKPK